MRNCLIAIGISFVLASPSFGEDDAASKRQQQIDDLKAQAELINAQTARINAQAAKDKARIDSLGLTNVAEGKTSLGTNGGVLESWMLSAGALDAAAELVARAVKIAMASGKDAPPTQVPSQPDPSPQGDVRATRTRNASEASEVETPQVSSAVQLPASEKPSASPSRDGRADAQLAAIPSPQAAPEVQEPRRRIVVLAGDEAFNPNYGDLVDDRIKSVLDAVKSDVDACGRDARTNLSGGGIAPGVALGLIKTDTEASGIDVPMKDRAFVAAVATRMLADFEPILPSAAVKPAKTTALYVSYSTLRGNLTTLHACEAGRTADAKTEAEKAELAKFLARTKTGDDLLASLLKPDDQGATPIARALATATLLDDQTMVLRLFVEKAGGSLLKRQNLWIALGFPAIGVSGGIIVSYTLTDPTGGVVRASGVATCRTRLTSMRAVQDGRWLKRSRGAAANCASVGGSAS